MSHAHAHSGDTAPGDEPESIEDVGKGLTGYLVGLAFAVTLTAITFYISSTTLVWTPSIPVAITVLAIAQMGVHIVFFLHITTGPDNTNNVMALAFGILIVMLIIGGSLWVMGELNAHMMALPQGQGKMPNMAM